jgi:hypothetical protein
VDTNCPPDTTELAIQFGVGTNKTGIYLLTSMWEAAKCCDSNHSNSGKA